MIYARSNMVESNPRYQAAVSEQRRREQARIEARKQAERANQLPKPSVFKSAEQIEEQRRERYRQMFEKAAEKFPIVAPDESKTVRGIIARVAEEFGVTSEEIISPRYTRELTRARHEAIYRVWIEKDPIGLAEIGRYFKRDHTTIISALRKKGVKDTSQRTRKSERHQHE